MCIGCTPTYAFVCTVVMSALSQPCFYCSHILFFVNVPLKDYIILFAPFFPHHISLCSAFSAQRQLVNSAVYNTATSWSTIPSPSARPTHLSAACLACGDIWRCPSHAANQITAHIQTQCLSLTVCFIITWHSAKFSAVERKCGTDASVSWLAGT